MANKPVTMDRDYFANIAEGQAKKLVTIMDIIKPYVYGCPCHKLDPEEYKKMVEGIAKIVYEY